MIPVFQEKAERRKKSEMIVGECNIGILYTIHFKKVRLKNRK